MMMYQQNDQTMKSLTQNPSQCGSLKFIDRRGAATVEFAIVSIVLVLLIFGGIEMTRVSMLRHTVDHAAYTAARNAIIPGAKAEDVIATAEEHLNIIGLAGATVTVNPPVIEDESSVVEVQVRLPISENSFFTPEYLFGDLVGRSALMTERSPMQMSASLPKPPPQTPSTQPPTPTPPIPTPPENPETPINDDGGGGDPPAAPMPPSLPPPPPPPPPML